MIWVPEVIAILCLSLVILESFSLIIHPHFCWLPGFVGAEIPLVAGWIFTSSFFVGDIFDFFSIWRFLQAAWYPPTWALLGPWGPQVTWKPRLFRMHFSWCPPESRGGWSWNFVSRLKPHHQEIMAIETIKDPIKDSSNILYKNLIGDFPRENLRVFQSAWPLSSWSFPQWGPNFGATAGAEPCGTCATSFAGRLSGRPANGWQLFI